VVELVALADATMVDWLHSSASPIRSRPIVLAYDCPRLCEARGKRARAAAHAEAGRVPQFDFTPIHTGTSYDTQLCAAGLTQARCPGSVI
jgi:hypothetical protein